MPQKGTAPMIVDRSLVVQYLSLSAVETGLYVYYAHDIVNFYYGQSRTEGLNILFSELSLTTTRVLSAVALCNAVMNDSLESFYVFVGLKLTIFVKLLLEIPLPHHFRYPFIYYLVPLVAQVVFVAGNYDTIIRHALWKYYKTVGSSPTLQNAHNIRTLLRVIRFLFYIYLVVRFWVFIVTYSELEGIRHITPYFYIIVLLDSLCCFYESREIVLCKLASLVLIVAMIVYMSIVFAWFVRQFEETEVGTIILDIVRAAIYLLCSLADYLYYGSGLKELYARGG